MVPWWTLSLGRWSGLVEELEAGQDPAANLGREWRQPLDHAISLDHIENAGVALRLVAKVLAGLSKRRSVAEVHHFPSLIDSLPKRNPKRGSHCRPTLFVSYWRSAAATRS